MRQSSRELKESNTVKKGKKTLVLYLEQHKYRCDTEFRRSAQGIWDPRKKPTAISNHFKQGWGPHHYVEGAVDWCSIDVQVFPLKPTPFCKFFAGIGSTNKSVISLLFFSSLTLVLFFPPCPLLRLSFYVNLCRFALSRVCCNGNSLLLNSYFSRIGRIENPS